MQETLRLGTVGRTRVGLHWSVVVIAFLLASTLATGVLPGGAPGFSSGIYWTMAIATTVVFLASLLGHELSHAFVARRRGMTVDGIVLWALGGVAKLNGDAPDARSELRMALAGPAASVVFAAAFGLGAFALRALGASALIVSALWWLAEVNGVLALFNLIPAYPLDGGRVLRAGLWRHWNDRRRATEISAAIGALVGTALIVLGIFVWLFVPAFVLNGIWLALIGWFVHGASRQERRAVHIGSALDGLRVVDAMHPVDDLAPAYATIEDVIDRYVRPGRLDCCPLVGFDGTVAGLVTVDQLGRVPAEQRKSTRASEVAWPLPSLAQITPENALAPVVRRLASLPSHCALVFDEGHVIGTLSPRDIERAVRSPAVSRAGVSRATRNSRW